MPTLTPITCTRDDTLDASPGIPVYNCFLEVFALLDQRLVQGCSPRHAACPTAELHPVIGRADRTEVGQELLALVPMLWKQLPEMQEELLLLAKLTQGW